MKTRLLAIDLDGTLLSHDKKISTVSIEAIKTAQDAGILVVLASGRIRPSMMPFAKTLGLDAGPMISGNGTHVVGLDAKELYRLDLSHELMQTIIDYATLSDLHLNLYTPDRLFFLRDTPWGDLYKSRVETIVPEILGSDVSQLEYLKAIIVSDPESMPRHKEKILAEIGNSQVRATESEAEYLEFMDERATKGYAIAHLAASLGIEREETAAIGDYLNDLEMLEYAGLSGAVGNAHPTIKKVANVVVSPNDLGGVSEFIHQIVLKQY